MTFDETRMFFVTTMFFSQALAKLSVMFHVSLSSKRILSCFMYHYHNTRPFSFPPREAFVQGDWCTMRSHDAPILLGGCIMRSHGAPMPSHKGLTNVEPFSLRTAVGKGGVATRCSIPGRLVTPPRHAQRQCYAVRKKKTSVWVTAQVVGSRAKKRTHAKQHAPAKQH